MRVTPNGAKSYVFQYRMGGRESRSRRYTIGAHGSPWTPSTARTEAERLALLVGQGVDPAEADLSRRREAVTLAFGPYAERFIELYLKEQWAGAWELGAGIIRRDVAPVLGKMSLPHIRRSHIAEMLDGMSDRPAVRRNAFAVLRRLFRWAVSRGDLVTSPLLEMDPPAAPAARERVLDDAELAEVWKASETLGYPFGPMFRLLIATGQRREEVAGLNWGELDRASATWVLPATRAKNKQTHIVPLSPLAMRVLDSVAPSEGLATWPKQGLVLTTTGETAVSGYSRAKRRLDKAVTAARSKAAEDAGGKPEPIEPWRPHDLRRTLATGLQRLGVRFEVTEAVLNHVSGARGGVAGVYQRHDWKDEKRAALNAWSEHVTSLFTEGTPETLSQARESAAPDSEPS